MLLDVWSVAQNLHTVRECLDYEVYFDGFVQDFGNSGRKEWSYRDFTLKPQILKCMKKLLKINH